MNGETAWSGSWGVSKSSLFDFMDFLAWWKVNIRGGQTWTRELTFQYEGSERKAKR